MRELSYNDVKKDIEVVIFGIKFKVSNKIEKINEQEILEKTKDNENVVEEIINEILGDNAIEKINNKLIEEGHEKMDLNIQTKVLNWTLNQYADELLSPINETVNKMQNYNRNYRRNKRNRYRRY